MIVKKRLISLTAALGLAAVVATVPGSSVAEQAGMRSNDSLREAMFVGNNWEGTVDIVSPDGELTKLGRMNVVPDHEERMKEIYANPLRLAYFLGIRQLVGEGHDQLVDDMYTALDGRLLVVSRPSFADVVALDMSTGELAWRFPVEGQRSDHMAISPDGTQVAVSASTSKQVHVLDVRTGEQIGNFPSGDTPHENNYSKDGSTIFHASIGRVYTPFDGPVLDTTKGERFFQVVDRETNEVLRRIDMGKKLEEAGYPGMSSAVRPMTLSPDEKTVYFQVSFFHGFVEYDLEQDRVRRVANLPNLVPDVPREQYLLDSAHHGIAMNPQGTGLCVAGTMSDYATVVDPETFESKGLVRGGSKPYWATNSKDGEHCFVSWSGDDTISAISYETGQEVASIPVGDHPQRIRMGHVREDALRTPALRFTGSNG